MYCRIEFRGRSIKFHTGIQMRFKLTKEYDFIAGVLSFKICQKSLILDRSLFENDKYPEIPIEFKFNRGSSSNWPKTIDGRDRCLESNLVNVGYPVFIPIENSCVHSEYNILNDKSKNYICQVERWNLKIEEFIETDATLIHYRINYFPTVGRLVCRMYNSLLQTVYKICKIQVIRKIIHLIEMQKSERTRVIKNLTISRFNTQQSY